MEFKEDIVQKMADNLPTLRKKAGLTQTQLADMLGVSKYTVLSIEKKQRNMTWSTFLSLILIFSKNKDTNKMLTLFGIYTDEFNDFIKRREKERTDENER